MVATLKTDSLKKIFDFLLETYGDRKSRRSIITDMNSYLAVNLTIEHGPKAYGCCIGFRNKIYDSGQVLQVWAHEPIGTDNSDEINALDPDPIVTLETYDEDTKGPQFKVDYSVGTLTTGVIPALTKVLGALQTALVIEVLEETVG